MEAHAVHRIGYVLKSFPTVSETFILNELAEVVRRGRDIRVYALAVGDTDHVHPDAASLMDRVTFVEPRRIGRVSKALGHAAFWCQSRARYHRAARHAARSGHDEFVWDFRNSVGLARLMQRDRITHIHAHYATEPASYAMWVSQLLGIPFTFTMHGYDLFFAPPANLAQRVELSSGVVCVSQYNRRYLQEQFGVPPDRLHVVHCGIDPERFCPDGGERPSPPIVLSVARLHAVKGLRYLVEACGILARRGADFRCIIAGDGPERQRLCTLRDELGLTDRVELVGPVVGRRLADLYRQAAVFVLPSVSESMGLANMEAMACETPVVATRVRGVPELVEDGVSGRLVRPEQPTEIANAVEWVLSDPQRARQLGQRGRRKVLAEFTVQTQVDQLERVWSHAPQPATVAAEAPPAAASAHGEPASAHEPPATSPAAGPPAPSHEPAGQHEDLKRTAAKGLSWSATKELAAGVARFGTTAVLARYLADTDFGMFALTVLFFGLFTLFSDIGFGAAIIQRRRVDDRLLCTSFWTNFLIGIGLYAALFFTAPLGAMFFRQPALTWTIRILGLSFIIGPLSNTNVQLMQKHLLFKRIALVEIGATLVYVGTVLTLVIGFHYSYTGLIWGLMAQRVATFMFRHVAYPWHPSFRFCRTDFRALFGFGKHMFGQRLVNYGSANGDKIVVGRLLGDGPLGQYGFAYALPHLVLTHFSRIILNMLFPLFAKIQDDTERMRRGFLTVIAFISLFTFPAMAGMAVLAHDLVFILYGERWLGIVLPMQILCLAAALRSVITATGYVFNAKGRPDIGLKWELAFTPFALVCIGIGAMWGLEGVATAIGLSLLGCGVIIHVLCRVLQMRWRDYLGALVPAAVSTAIMVAAVAGVHWLTISTTNVPVVPRTLGCVAVGVVAYTALLRLLFPAPFRDLFEFACMMVGRRSRQTPPVPGSVKAAPVAS